MDIKLTGIINPGDTRGIKEWMEKNMGSKSDLKNDLVDIKLEMKLLRQTIELMDKKIDKIEQILEKVSD